MSDINSYYTYFCQEKNIENRVNKVIAASLEKGGKLYDYFKEQSFTNLPPKIGYFNEKTVPLYAHYNMSYSAISGMAWSITADSDGQEVIYFFGSDNGTKATKVYKCTRTDISNTSGFVYGNQPLKPKCVDIELNRIFGIENTYMIARATDSKWYRFDTNYSSNTDTWTATEVTSMINATSGCTKALWFADVKRYLLLSIRSNKVYLTVYNDKLEFQWEDEILDSAKAKYENHPDYTISLNYYGDGGGCSGLCYIPPKNILVVNVGYKAYFKDEHGVYFYTNGNGGYVDHITFTPQNLLTEHYFTSATWNMGAETWYNLDNSNIRGNNTYTFGLEWCTMTMSYDAVNQYFYTTKVQRDLSECVFWRVPVDKLDTSVKGANISFNNATSWTINTPDTSPWAKQNNAASVIYGNLYLWCRSNRYGWRSVAVTPEDTDDKTRKSVVAGSWKLCDSNIDWAAGNDHYCCVREDFNKTDGCSWYQMTYDDTYLYIYRLAYKDRTDSAGNKRSDYLYRPDGYIARFKRPTNLSYWDYPKGISFIYRSKQFGGENRLIIWAQSNREAVLNDDGTYSQKDDWCVPRFIIIKEDGSYNMIEMPQDIIDWWLATANSAYPQVRGAHANRAPFLDHDGQTFYIGCHAYWYADSYTERGYKVVFSDDFKSLVSMVEIPGQNGEWCGRESVGWCKKYGYTRTVSDRICSYVQYSKNSADEAIWGNGECKKFYLDTEGSVGLIAYLQSIPIYLGGYYSIVDSAEIYLKPNKDNYIYLVRDPDDYTKVNTEVYTSPLSASDAENDLDFSRILVAKITTNDKQATSQVDYLIDHYGPLRKE